MTSIFVITFGDIVGLVALTIIVIFYGFIMLYSNKKGKK